jgi:hypothetical protein
MFFIIVLAIIFGLAIRNNSNEENSRAWQRRNLIQDIVIKKLLIKNSLQQLWIDERTKWTNCTILQQMEIITKRNKLKRLYCQIKNVKVIYSKK